MFLSDAITQKQIDLIKRMNRLCVSKFDITIPRYKKEASKWIALNLDEFISVAKSLKAN